MFISTGTVVISLIISLSPMIRHGVPAGEPSAEECETEEYLRLQSEEDSLEKHRKIVLINPDDYRSWHCIKRRLSGQTTQGAIEEQLNLTQKAIEANPKSYCTWHHRYFFYKDAKMSSFYERKLCKALFSLDPRNFHCWNYCRRLGFVMPVDFRNYSSMFAGLTGYEIKGYESRENKLLRCGSNTIRTGHLVSNCSADTLLRAERNIYTDPDDEGAWRHYSAITEYKGDKSIFYVRRSRTDILVIFRDPFIGTVEFRRKPHEIQCFVRAYRIIDQEENDSELSITLNGVPYTLCMDSEPAVVEGVLQLNRDCVFALKERLSFTKDECERERIVGRLSEIDPLRSAYYRTLRFSRKYSLK